MSYLNLDAIFEYGTLRKSTSNFVSVLTMFRLAVNNKESLLELTKWNEDLPATFRYMVAKMSRRSLQ